MTLSYRIACARDAGKENLDRRKKSGVRSSADMAHGSMTDRSLGEVVRDGRLAKEWSLRDLAKRVAKTPSYLSDIENDRRVPAEEMLKDLARLLDLDFNDLMARAGRFGEDIVRYVTREPMAGALFRQVSGHNLNSEQIRRLSEYTEELASEEKKVKR